MFLFEDEPEYSEPGEPVRWVTSHGQRHRSNQMMHADRPLILLEASDDVMRELRSARDCPFYFGPGGADPVLGIDSDLRDAVRLATHPVDLLRRLGQWVDRAQATVPPAQIATCWHPAITPELLRQASRYPVRVVEAFTAEEAIRAAGPILEELTIAGAA